MRPEENLWRTQIAAGAGKDGGPQIENFLNFKEFWGPEATDRNAFEIHVHRVAADFESPHTKIRIQNIELENRQTHNDTSIKHSDRCIMD